MSLHAADADYDHQPIHATTHSRLNLSEVTSLLLSDDDSISQSPAATLRPRQFHLPSYSGLPARIGNEEEWDDLTSDGSITPPTIYTPLLSKRTAPSRGDKLSEATEGPSKIPTPLPMQQLTILLVGQLPEPVVATVLFPFINQLVSEVGVTGGDDRKVGYYAGFIESLFFLAEFTMVLRWGRLSDRIGRKPVILTGLLGLSLSSLCFGVSKTYGGLVVSRALAGLLSGNIGVMKSAIGEITDETNIAEGFALLPVVWSAGATIGPLMGGFLSRPADKWPRLFGAQFWHTYPYFLPCGAAALVSLISFSIVAFFFEESLPTLKRTKVVDDKEYQPLPSSNHVSMKRIAHQRSSSEETLVELVIPKKQPSIRDIATRPVVVAISNYCALALLDIAFCALLPLFCASSIADGGLGLTPAMIGLILGILGLVNGVVQGLFSARAQRRFGIKNVYLAGVICYFGMFGAFPVLTRLAAAEGMSSRVWVLLALQLFLTICANMSFGCIFLFITGAAEKTSLGATNGLAQTMVSLMRMIGPATATSLFAVTMEKRWMDGLFVYWFFLAMTCLSLLVAIPLPRRTLGNL